MSNSRRQNENNTDKKKDGGGFWLWEVPPRRRIACLSGLAMMILVAILLPDKGAFASLFPGWTWIGWVVMFVLIGIPGVLVEIIVERLLKKPDTS